MSSSGNAARAYTEHSSTHTRMVKHWLNLGELKLTDMCSAFTYKIAIICKTCAFNYIRQLLKFNWVIIQKNWVSGHFVVLISTVQLMCKWRTWIVSENCALLGHYAKSSGNFLDISGQPSGPNFKGRESKKMFKNVYCLQFCCLHPCVNVINIRPSSGIGIWI
jgi:hypothetical protein